MKMLLLTAFASITAIVMPVAAQTMDHSTMPGIAMPAKPAHAQSTPAGASQCTPEHAAMGHCKMPATTPPADPHAGHVMPAPPATDAPKTEFERVHGTGGTSLAPGNVPAPTAPEANYADRVWGRAAMLDSREMLRQHHGGGRFSQIMFNLAEYQLRDGRDGFRWDAEGWFGGDINRLVVKSEGGGNFGERIDHAEVQALYSRAIGPYFDLQAGVRHDITPNPSRSYATVGVEGLAPYWFDVEAALFLSDKGDLLARIGGSYDQRITQRLILQPRAELNFAAQDVPENGIGAGLSDIELGLRLRYELAREFAPYVGVSWDRKLGNTADFARAAGETPSSTSLVFGVRAWF
jgi:copper resistance protein B